MQSVGPVVRLGSGWRWPRDGGGAGGGKARVSRPQPQEVLSAVRARPDARQQLATWAEMDVWAAISRGGLQCSPRRRPRRGGCSPGRPLPRPERVGAGGCGGRPRWVVGAAEGLAQPRRPAWLRRVVLAMALLAWVLTRGSHVSGADPCSGLRWLPGQRAS